jgi:hypothetical protein
VDHSAQGEVLVMGYSNNESMCRIDFFRDGGKWHETEDFDMTYYFGSSDTAGTKNKFALLPEAIIASLRDDRKFRRADGGFRYSGCWAVVLEPYHEHAHPQMFRVPERFDLDE